MNTLQIFFGEFWPIFFGVSFGLSLVWLARRFASDGHLPFIGPKSFTELADFPKAEQKRLLHEASKEASGHWRSFVPVILFAVLFSFGFAVGRTLPKVTTLHDSFWVHIVFACPFAVFGGSLAGRLEVRYVRSFLRSCIERTKLAV